jgi:hypothetical protein
LLLEVIARFYKYRISNVTVLITLEIVEGRMVRRPTREILLCRFGGARLYGL